MISLANSRAKNWNLRPERKAKEPKGAGDFLRGWGQDRAALQLGPLEARPAAALVPERARIGPAPSQPDEQNQEEKIG